jgi:hypothetical protein
LCLRPSELYEREESAVAASKIKDASKWPGQEFQKRRFALGSMWNRISSTEVRECVFRRVPQIHVRWHGRDRSVGSMPWIRQFNNLSEIISEPGADAGRLERFNELPMFSSFAAYRVE